MVLQDLIRNAGSIVDLTCDREFSNSEVQTEVANSIRRISAAVALKPGDRVILKNENCAEFLFQLFALWSLGANVIPVSSTSTTGELKKIVSIAQPRAIFSKAFRSEEFASSSGDGDDEEGLALTLFTSGSTADPKGVVISRKAIVKKIEILGKYILPPEAQRTLCLLPTYFSHGLISNCLFPLLSGHTLYMARPLEMVLARRLPEVISHHEISFFSTVPVLWNLILSAPRTEGASSLKRVHCASAHLHPSLLPQILDWLRESDFYYVFGTTETLSWVGAKKLSTGADNPCIRNFWGSEFRIEKEHNEIQIRTEALFSEYLANPVLTAQSITPDGFFRTGDYGHKTESGEIFVQGRLLSIINKGGVKISPEEIDEALLNCLGVLEACAFAEPSSFYGDTVSAAIVLASGYLQNAKTEARILSQLSCHLSSYKIPERLYFVQSLPRSDRGKVMRSETRRQVLEKKT